MIQAVLDTNVVLSGLLFGGTPWAVVQAGIHGRLRMVTSPALVAELDELVGRPKFSARLEAIGYTSQSVVRRYIEAAHVIAVQDVPRVVVADPDDDFVLACAVAGQVDWIVSGDRKHVLPLGRHQNIDILTVRQAIERLVG